MKKRISISVGTLVEHSFRTGDLSFDTFSPILPREGIFAHQKIQKSRPEIYESEVSISNSFDRGDYLIEISGRMDGLFHYSDRFVIEEIKTTNRDLNISLSDWNPMHWGQLKIYAYLLALREDLREVEVQLTYYHMTSGHVEELPAKFSFRELSEFFDTVISQYISKIEALDNWRKTRDESIKNLNFPFLEYRPGQRKIAVETYLAIKEGRQMIIQAATGTGKTVSVVFPSLKAMMEGLTSCIFYLTARTTGKKSAEDTLCELRKKGLRLKSVTLTAREKICFMKGGECTPNECQFAKGYFDRIDEARKNFFLHDAFFRENIEKIAMEHSICPFEFSLELAMLADMIICDYNYVFDPGAYLRRMFIDNANSYLFLVDEAHNLVDRSRDMFSAEIFKQEFLNAARPIKKSHPLLAKSIDKINKYMLKYRTLCDERGSFIREENPPLELVPLLKNFIRTAEALFQSNVFMENRDKILELYFSSRGFLRVMEEYDSGYAAIYEQNRRDLRIKLFCIDPSSQLKKCLKKGRSSIFYSATMYPTHYFKRLFGCDTSTKVLVLGSPFPGENLCTVLFDGISTLYRKREKSREKAANLISTVIGGKKGNYLLFFPSYAYMEMVYSTFTRNNPEIETIIQSPGMSEEQRSIFLSRFMNNNPSTLAGFAVMGGIFGEGIDLAGERLSGALIYGVGLPSISPERDIIRDHFSKTDGAGYEYAYMFPGINRVFQAAGRVIRSEHDKGIVVLVDERFKGHRYRSLFPVEWNPVRVNSSEYLLEILNNFWNKQTPALKK